jgi:hypothetical protein
MVIMIMKMMMSVMTVMSVFRVGTFFFLQMNSLECIHTSSKEVQWLYFWTFVPVPQVSICQLM